MNRYEYKNYWIEIFIEGDELEDCENPFSFVPYVEIPEEGGVATTGDRYATVLEARQGAEKFIDMLDSFEDSETNWIEALPTEDEYEAYERDRALAYAEERAIEKEEANEPEYVPLGEYTDKMFG